MSLEFNQIIQSGLQLYHDYLVQRFFSRKSLSAKCFKIFENAIYATRFGGAFHQALKMNESVLHTLQLSFPNMDIDYIRNASKGFMLAFVQLVNEELKTDFPPLKNFSLCQVPWESMQFYKQGDDNLVLIKKDQSKVFRRALNPFDEMTRLERVFDIFRRIYPEAPITARSPWLELPFWGFLKPSDDAIADELLRIYRETRIIITDGWVDGNFLLYQGKAVCVDVDHGVWRGDSISEAYVEHVFMGTDRYRTMCKSSRPHIATICTLFYLEKYLKPEEINPTYLVPHVMESLHHYRRSHWAIDITLLESLYLKPRTIYQAAKEGDLRKLKQYLHWNKASLNVPDRQGRTALMWACSEGHHTLVVYLLRQGALFDAQGGGAETPLSLAEEGGHSSIVDILRQAESEKISMSKSLDVLSKESSLEQRSAQHPSRSSYTQKLSMFSRREDVLTVGRAEQAYLVYQKERKESALRLTPFHCLSKSLQEGCFSFIEAVDSGATPEEAWACFASGARSQEFRALGVHHPAYHALSQNKKDALNAAFSYLHESKTRGFGY